MPVDPRANSRFSDSVPILSRDGRETYGIATKYDFLSRDNLKSDEIGQIVINPDLAGRPDLLADEIYGNVDLMWIAVIFNNVQNPLNWPTNNQVVEFPIPSVVFAEL
tara:strand:+ start:22664 stop:22984 length:321 start_codon:yes stop_codon:yes gene_type:complete